MRFADIYTQKSPALSLEFFPPKHADGLAGVKQQIKELADCCDPNFMTVTYGAGGGTRAFTRSLVSYIHNDLRRSAAAHLTCVGHSVEEIDEILNALAAEGIDAVVALRGDPQDKAEGFRKHPHGFANALELTAHIKTRGGFSVAVAGYPEGHPEAASREADVNYLKAKVDAGADAVITQLFFEAETYFHFRDNAARAGVDVPLVPGIMPIGSVSQIKRFTTMCGATIPAKLDQALAGLEDDPAAVVQFGIEYAVELCEQLLRAGVPGVHIYTLNKSVQARPIVEALGLGKR